MSFADLMTQQQQIATTQAAIYHYNLLRESFEAAMKRAEHNNKVLDLQTSEDAQFALQSMMIELTEAHESIQAHEFGVAIRKLVSAAYWWGYFNDEQEWIDLLEEKRREQEREERRQIAEKLGKKLPDKD